MHGIVVFSTLAFTTGVLMTPAVGAAARDSLPRRSGINAEQNESYSGVVVS